MKCEACQGTGLENENKLCIDCNGFGVVGVEDRPMENPPVVEEAPIVKKPKSGLKLLKKAKK